MEGVGDDHDAVPAAARVAALKGPLGPGQVLVGGAAALLGEDGAIGHAPLAGPAGPRPALGEAVAGLLAPGEHQHRGHLVAPQLDGVLEAGLVDGRRPAVVLGRPQDHDGVDPGPLVLAHPPGHQGSGDGEVGEHEHEEANQDAAHARILRSLRTWPFTGPGGWLNTASQRRWRVGARNPRGASACVGYGVCAWAPWWWRSAWSWPPAAVATRRAATPAAAAAPPRPRRSAWSTTSAAAVTSRSTTPPGPGSTRPRR